MADEITLPVLSGADINGIITAGADGNYSITYTNLTANQIAEIGLAFEQAMQRNLKTVALSGEYDSLEKKPSIPSGYTQEDSFAAVAFSGNTSDLNNNSGFITEEDYSALPVSNITEEDIENWNNIDTILEQAIIHLIGTSNEENLIDNEGNYYTNFINIKNSIENKIKVFDLKETYHYDLSTKTDFVIEYSDESKHLIEEIFAYDLSKNIICLKYENNYWPVSQFVNADGTKGIVLNKLNFSYDHDLSTGTEQLEDITYNEDVLAILYDLGTKCTFFKFYTNNFLFEKTFKRYFDYAIDLNATDQHPYLLTTDKDLYDSEGYPEWSRLVTVDYLAHELSKYQLKSS